MLRKKVNREGPFVYDAFISYAKEDESWVMVNNYFHNYATDGNNDGNDGNDDGNHSHWWLDSRITLFPKWRSRVSSSAFIPETFRSKVWNDSLFNNHIIISIISQLILIAGWKVNHWKHCWLHRCFTKGNLSYFEANFLFNKSKISADMEFLLNILKVVLVLSQQYTASHWCMFEAHMSQHRLVQVWKRLFGEWY